MIALLILLLALPAAADSLAESQVRFGVITGDVGLLTQGASDWIVPHEGLPIEAGDHIRTGEDGKVEILSTENTLWMLEPESDVITESMDTNTGVFNLSSGTLRGKIDSGRTAGIVQRWEFNTPAAVAVVHGTEFSLSCSKKDGTHLAVYEGSVSLEPAETAAGLQPRVEVSAGHEGVVQRGRAVHILGKFSPDAHSWSAELPAFRRRLTQVENTWSPFTPQTRLDARRKFVPVVKVKPHRPVAPKRKIPVANSSSSL